MQGGWEAGDSGRVAEGSGRVQGSLTKPRPPRQSGPLEDPGQPPGLGEVKGSGHEEVAGERGQGHVQHPSGTEGPHLRSPVWDSILTHLPCCSSQNPLWYFQWVFGARPSSQDTASLRSH